MGRLGWEEKRYSYVTRCLQEWSCTEGFTLRVSKRKRRRDMGRRKGFERNLEDELSCGIFTQNTPKNVFQYF